MSIPTNMRLFQLRRAEDVSGSSGTGTIAEGVEFSNGMCALTWLTPYRCVNVYENIKALEAIHGHEGRTGVYYLEKESAE